MKKPLFLLLILLIAFPCLSASAQSTDPNQYSGYWLDAWSGRAHMTITFDGERHKAVVHWANSAFDSIEWSMSGLFTGGVLASEDCTKRHVSYEEDGVREESVLYAGHPAVLTLSDGVITWTDSEGMGADCRFERYEEIDMREVYNPERYAHLYVTGIYSSPDGSRIYCQGTLGTIHENGKTSGFDLREALTFALSPDCLLSLPENPANPASAEAAYDPAAWFSAPDGSAGSGFYAILTLNEAGEIEKLVYSADQPDAPTLPAPEEEPVLIAPAPPTGK